MSQYLFYLSVFHDISSYQLNHTLKHPGILHQGFFRRRAEILMIYPDLWIDLKQNNLIYMYT